MPLGGCRTTAVAWHEADWSSVGLLPPARADTDAEVYVFAARTGRWKGIFAHHSWIVTKERGRLSYPLRHGGVGKPIKVDNWAPDARWYGDAPTPVGSCEVRKPNDNPKDKVCCGAVPL